MFSREQDMVQTLRLIEGLKVSLLDNLSAVYHAMAKDSTEAVQQALARFLANVYVLGRRLGIDYRQLEKETLLFAQKQAASDDDKLEKRFGDFTKLAKYLQGKRSHEER